MENKTVLGDAVGFCWPVYTDVNPRIACRYREGRLAEKAPSAV